MARVGLAFSRRRNPRLTTPEIRENKKAERRGLAPLACREGWPDLVSTESRRAGPVCAPNNHPEISRAPGRTCTDTDADLKSAASALGYGSEWRLNCLRREGIAPSPAGFEDPCAIC